MAGGTGIRTVTGGVSSSNPAEKLLEKVTDFSRHVVTTSGSVWSYGNWPATYSLTFTGAAGTNDNDVVYTSGDVSMYNEHIIECTAGTVDIQVTVDGTNWNTTQAAVLLHDDVTTGGGVKSVTIASGKIGILTGKYKKIRILQNGATASNARGLHNWS